MIKIIPPRAWSWDFDGPQLEEVKISSFGLRGNDLAALVKRASHPLANWVKSNSPKPGEVYVHSMNLGSTEKVGANRNGDGYSDKMLQSDHPTFESAHFFLNHQNKDPKKSYGLVKKAFYNRDIGRVDAIAALNGTKEAAERNGGLLATRTLNKMASGMDVAVSQSCTVPIDVCNSCGNKAKNRSEYCDSSRCKYGGCKDNLGRVFDDGFHLFVDNPKCNFFDLSDVSDTRGADRTAFITGKVAASDRVMGGAELAEALGLVAPDHLLDPRSQGVLSCLRKLAALRYPDFPVSPSWDDCISIRTPRHKKAGVLPFPNSDYERHMLVADMAGAGVILPPARWLSYMTGVEASKCAVAFDRPLSVDRDLLGRIDCHDIIASTVVPTTLRDNRISVEKWAYLIPTTDSHARESALGLLTPTTIVKASATASPMAAEARAKYIAYQGRVLDAHASEKSFGTLLVECARHNRGLTM